MNSNSDRLFNSIIQAVQDKALKIEERTILSTILDNMNPSLLDLESFQLTAEKLILWHLDHHERFNLVEEFIDYFDDSMADDIMKAIRQLLPYQQSMISQDTTTNKKQALYTYAILFTCSRRAPETVETIVDKINVNRLDLKTFKSWF